MASKPIYIVSDIHLGGVGDEVEREFRRFLHEVRDRASGLLINGDLFDFWFEYSSVIASEHYRVLAALRDVVEASVPIWFVGGNHDAWGGPFLRNTVGMELIEGPARIELGGRRALVAHGDAQGGPDRRYLAMRWLIRHPVLIRAFRLVHPDIAARIARVVSTTDQKIGDPERASLPRLQRLSAWAAERFRSDREIDLVVTGHVHRPIIEELEPGRFHINAGDWINNRSYVVLPAAGPPTLHFWR